MTRATGPMDLSETRAALRRDLSAEERDQLWARIDAQIPLERPSQSLSSRLRPETPWPRWAWALSSAFVVLNIWFGYENFFKDQGPLTLANGQALSTASAETSPRHLHFSDQSTIAVHPHSQLTALAMTEDQVLLRLEHGSAQFHVKKGGPRRWRVETGVLAVEVIGTRFFVDRSAERVLVKVSEGRVLVRSPALTDGVVRLDPGQEVTVRAFGPHAPHTTDSKEAPTSLPIQPDVAAAGQPAEASSADAAQSMSAPSAKEQPALARLLAEADQARAAGETKRAASLLRSIIQLYPADPQAALSSFALGRIYQREGQWTAADAAYGWALHHGASGSLREDCYLRRIEVRLHHAPPLAERTAREYLGLYPQGRHRAAVEHMLPSSAAPKPATTGE